jgi:hypothetical protein
MCGMPLSPGNEWGSVRVYPGVRVNCLKLAAPAVLATIGWAAYTDYASAKHKFDLIESERLRPGTQVQLTAGELNAYAAHEAPAGVRDTQLQIDSSGLATGRAVVDFNALGRSEGHPPGWLLSRLLEGERPVSVTAHLTSSNHQAQVHVERVTVSGIEIDGATLDFLIQHFLLALYPDAAVDRPFELAHHIERLDLKPGAVNVVIGR